MIFNNISTEKKIEALTSARSFHEENLYDSLLRLGLDPETFEEASFNPDDESFPVNLREMVDNISRCLEALSIIQREIDNASTEA